MALTTLIAGSISIFIWIILFIILSIMILVSNDKMISDTIYNTALAGTIVGSISFVSFGIAFMTNK